MNKINLSVSEDEMEGRLREQLEYDVFLESYPHRKGRLDEIVSLIADTLLEKSETVRIGGADVPRGRAVRRFHALNFEHVEYVLDRMEETACDIRNIRAYLLTSLYNAPVTMDSYYDAESRRDMP